MPSSRSTARRAHLARPAMGRGIRRVVTPGALAVPVPGLQPARSPNTPGSKTGRAPQLAGRCLRFRWLRRPSAAIGRRRRDGGFPGPDQSRRFPPLSRPGPPQRRRSPCAAPSHVQPCVAPLLRLAPMPWSSPIPRAPARPRGDRPGRRWQTADPSSTSETETGAFAGHPRPRRALVRARPAASRAGWRHARPRPGPVPVLAAARRVYTGRRPSALSPGTASGPRRLFRYCATRRSRPRSSPHHQSGDASHPTGALPPDSAATQAHLASVHMAL